MATIVAASPQSIILALPRAQLRAIASPAVLPPERRATTRFLDSVCQRFASLAKVKLAHTERLKLCDLFLEVGPDAPTLDEGWTTADLAAHLWVRENDPLAAPGIFMQRFADLTDKRMAEARAKFTWHELINAIRLGPPRLSIFGIPGMDEAGNALEFFVHHEDVRRAATPPAEPRELDPETEDFFWKRLTLLGRSLFRRTKVGVTVERPGSIGDVLRVHPGSRIVTLIGRPSELMLFAYGRTSVAQVQMVGDDESIALLTGDDLKV